MESSMEHYAAMKRNELQLHAPGLTFHKHGVEEKKAYTA